MVLRKKGSQHWVPEAALFARQGRAAFTAYEDAALLQWVARNPQLRPTGQHLWKAAEKAGLTRRTWQSMNNRYRRHLVPNLSLQLGRGDLGSGICRIKDEHAAPKCHQQKGCPVDLQFGSLLQRRKQQRQRQLQQPRQPCPQPQLLHPVRGAGRGTMPKKAVKVLRKEGCQYRVPEAALSARQRRAAFTADEDAALMQWVASNPQLRPTGQRLWKAAEKAGVTRHTWQSMNNRFRRHLVPNQTSLQPGRGDPGYGIRRIKDEHAALKCNQQRGCLVDLQLGSQRRKQQEQQQPRQQWPQPQLLHPVHDAKGGTMPKKAVKAATSGETLSWRHVIPLLHPVVCARRTEPAPAVKRHRYVLTEAVPVGLPCVH